MKTPINKRPLGRAEVERLQKNLCYANRVIELFLPQTTTDTLDIMESVITRGVKETFSGEDGTTMETYVLHMSELMGRALHTERLHDEDTF